LVGWLSLLVFAGGCSAAAPVPHTLESGLVSGDGEAIDGDPVVAPEAPKRAGVASVSLGRPNAGALYRGVAMPTNARWELVVPRHSWGTQETVDGIIDAVADVHDQHGDAHPLHVGDLSREFGGPLYPHRSHQSGRDVDLGYYYEPGKAQWYRRASAKTLDHPRTWTLLKALITNSDVEYIFIDRSVQRLLHEYALSIGEDREWLATIIQYKSIQPGAIVRHAHGHATHMHVRFYSPDAQERGREMYEAMVEQRLIGHKKHVSEHRVKAGDDLGALAQRYGTPVHRILRANRLRSNALEPGDKLRIPRRGRISPVFAVQIPPRPIPGRQATTANPLAAEDR
jgi:murein endopeptidase